MDGSIRIVGTEFIKLENTGSSNLATEEYAQTQVAEGGGGGSSWTGYSNLEIDTLLNSKANQSTTYTKTEVDTSLGSKANTADVYTQSQIDTSLGLKANLSNPVFTANVTLDTPTTRFGHHFQQKESFLGQRRRS